MSEASSTKSGRKPRTVRCLLCRGLVQLRNDGEQRIGVEKFKAHMENERGAYFDLEFILAASFMDEEEKEAVKVVIDAKDIEEEQDVEEVGLVVKMECESETEEGTSTYKDGQEDVSKIPQVLPDTCVACVKCEQRFEKAEHLRIHMKVIHTGATPEKKTEFYCEKFPAVIMITVGKML